MGKAKLPSFGYRKRGKLEEGDVFQIPLPDGRHGYGIILRRGGLKSGATPYIALFRPAFEEPAVFGDLSKVEVALAGWTMDSLVYHGKWVVLARKIPLPKIPLPNFKVRIQGKLFVTDVEGNPLREASAREAGSLDNQFSCTPMIFQDAFEALHGFGEWKNSYDKLTPNYAAERAVR